MVTIQTLTDLDEAVLKRLIVGYTSAYTYTVRWTDTDAFTHFGLELMTLEQPITNRYAHLDEETLTSYQEMLRHRLSLGAFEDGQMVALALAEPEHWNGSLWIREFHVAESHQHRGIGRQLIEAVAEKARSAGLRVLVCETQTTNVPAIRFYRSVGFALEGIDLSYYTNHDWPDGQIAVFMKRKL